MLGTIVRIAFMRVLPRRLIPLLTAWEVIRLIRGRQGRSSDAGGTEATPRSRLGRRG